MKEEYTPAEADILLLKLPGLELKDAVGGSNKEDPGIGGGGYDPDGWA